MTTRAKKNSFMQKVFNRLTWNLPHLLFNHCIIILYIVIYLCLLLRLDVVDVPLQLVISELVSADWNISSLSSSLKSYVSEMLQCFLVLPLSFLLLHNRHHRFYLHSRQLAHLQQHCLKSDMLSLYRNGISCNTEFS